MTGVVVSPDVVDREIRLPDRIPEVLGDQTGLLEQFAAGSLTVSLPRIHPTAGCDPSGLLRGHRPFREHEKYAVVFIDDEDA